MRVCFCVLVGIAFLAAASSAPAGITDAWCMDDGDGAIDCVATFDFQSYEMSIVGDQFSSPGHMLGEFTTDTAEDPTVMMWNSIDNDTGFVWTGFQVNLKMDNLFTLSDALVYTPNDWTAALIQPTQVGADWIGSVVYSAGTPVAPTETLEFSYKMSFDGALSYQFCQEMMPVPEPTTLALLLIGAACGLAAYRRKSV